MVREELRTEREQIWDGAEQSIACLRFRESRATAASRGKENENGARVSHSADHIYIHVIFGLGLTACLLGQ